MTLVKSSIQAPLRNPIRRSNSYQHLKRRAATSPPPPFSPHLLKGGRYIHRCSHKSNVFFTKFVSARVEIVATFISNFSKKIPENYRKALILSLSPSFFGLSVGREWGG